MSHQQYPPHPQHQQYPQQQPYPYAPPPPKKNTGKVIGFSCLGVVVAFIIIGVIGAAVSGGDGDNSSYEPDSPAAAAKDKPAGGDESDDKAKPEGGSEAKAEEKPELSQAAQFKACVADNGTETEKAAVKHVTKVTGTDERNDILDAAEVFTDYEGDMFSADSASGKLIASAFASCYESDNGLVTVYNTNGEILSNGNY
ncbi:hypothetical protein V1J52_05150 [Streptomyces sp. TRM 70351]|uniref:hypothetical protein n=1 Tax=Streptomyces sp. TRM 70351 TaxID=3116552 RepID=UPI002E7AD336|nr:hypothetical protein [Streptomyces sp. TRM 70351]MEE1927581.1 hypothetical protein [Streptomyces sp. TRM 70351]